VKLITGDGSATGKCLTSKGGLYKIPANRFSLTELTALRPLSPTRLASGEKVVSKKAFSVPKPDALDDF
jgi:hypothetical protein